MVSAFISRNISTLFSRMESLVAEKRMQVDGLRPFLRYNVSEITVGQLIDGQKGVKSLICETSKVEGTGIRFRGLSLKEVLEKVPGKHKVPSAEAVLWLLLTGEIPNYDEFEEVRQYLELNSGLSEETEKLIIELPKDIHPMTQFAIAVNSMTSLSKYSKDYFITRKEDKWKLMLEDGLILLAKLPRIAALIYRSTFKDGKLGKVGQSDMAENYSRMLGWKDESFFEAIRLFLLIHSDHEGGNVSTHASRLVGSAGSNVFESYVAGLNGLAGPIHGMGMQNCIMWLVEVWRTLGDNIDENTVEVYLKGYLETNTKIPGFGHPVLKSTDERFLAQLSFAQTTLKPTPLFTLISILHQVVPSVLKDLKRPPQYANMYLHSAAILFYHNLRMYEYYCVLFGLSRSLGIISNLVWDVALILPPEALLSQTIEDLESLS